MGLSFRDGNMLSLGLVKLEFDGIIKKIKEETNNLGHIWLNKFISRKFKPNLVWDMFYFEMTKYKKGSLPELGQFESD